MAQGSVILNTFYSSVEKALSDPNNVKKIKLAVNEFIDRNRDKLTALGPTYKIIFTDSDMEKIFDVIDIPAIKIKEVIDKTPYLKNQKIITITPFNVIMPLLIRYFKLKKNEDMVNTCLIYLTLSTYPMVHYKYFRYEPNENIMNYTINNLSNKFKIKQSGTLYQSLVDMAVVSDKNYHAAVLRCTDKDIVDYLMSLKTRLSTRLKKISTEFYKNEKNKLYLNIEIDNTTDEDNYHEADSNMFLVDRVTNNVVLKLLVNGPNFNLIKLSANYCQVSVNELRNYIHTMINTENREEIKQIIESILYLFFYDSQNTKEQINSNKFLLYCLELYKKSNTTDKNIIKIKRILDGWLERLGTYKKTQRLATINNFRKALFMFFVTTIQTANV